MLTQSPNAHVRAGFIGCGGWARNFHMRQMLGQLDTTTIVAVCEPVPAVYAEVQKQFEAAGQPIPPNEPDPERFLTTYGPDLDAVIITSPHKFHHDHAVASLEAGLDVLLEKPMVMNAAEAQSLIDARTRTGRHLVVSFQGSLSPQIRRAVELLRAGKLGRLVSISGSIWQNWRSLTVGTWRQDPALSGGGFMFDTGAHLLNTTADLAGEDFVEVSAWIDRLDTPVDILVTAQARLRSGALVTLHGSGDSVSCRSEIFVYGTEGVLRTGAWGERLQMHRTGRKTMRGIKVEGSLGPWQQFLRVRSGEIPNPSPPEVGLRMAQLWDMINESAAQGGQPVTRA